MGGGSGISSEVTSVIPCSICTKSPHLRMVNTGRSCPWSRQGQTLKTRLTWLLAKEPWMRSEPGSVFWSLILPKDMDIEWQGLCFLRFQLRHKIFWIILNSPLPWPSSHLPVLYLANSSKVPSGQNLNREAYQRHLRFSRKTQIISSLSTVVSSYSISWSEVGDQNLLRSLVSELAKKSIDSTENQFIIYY